MTETKPASVLKGIALVVAAVFLFALADTTGKHLFAVHSVIAVSAVRYAVNLLLLLALLGPSQGSSLWRTQRTGLVVLRGLILVAATFTMSLALRVMPVGETVAILYLSPFLVMLLAGPLLGERVSRAMWIGAAVSFAGVLLIARPGGGLNPTGIALMLVNAGLATAYHLLTRGLARSETTIAMLFHAALSGGLVFGVLALVVVRDFAPSANDFGLMLVLGVLSTAGHFLFTAAYREAPASLLAPINYLHLVFAGILGFVVFKHVPDGPSLMGMAAIALSGMAVAVLAHRARPKTA